jgi:hypothetical protein
LFIFNELQLSAILYKLIEFLLSFQFSKIPIQADCPQGELSCSLLNFPFLKTATLHNVADIRSKVLAQIKRGYDYLSFCLGRIIEVIHFNIDLPYLRLERFSGLLGFSELGS